ncbi:hypothetical protein [Rhodoplanes sp. SY1]|uniref:hypothetical protein n=1 Tax=Rhodoplanes sp. SY1 TaxID=3166646 RepID=UPI0038B528E5
MSSATTERADRIIATLRDRAPLTAADRDFLAAVVEGAGRVGLLDHIPIEVTSTLQRRDDLIRSIAAKFFGAATVRARAAALAAALARYEAGAWRRDRAAEDNPRRPGTLEAMAWEVLRLHPRPLGAERVRQIIAAVRG